MKGSLFLLGLVVTIMSLWGCGLGPGRDMEPWESDHPWFADTTIEIPGENLADPRVFSAVRDLAQESGISTRDLLIEFRGTVRSVADGPMAGFRALPFAASVSGGPAAVQTFVDRLEGGEPYSTLVVDDKTIAEDGRAASIRFTVYTLPAQ